MKKLEQIESQTSKDLASRSKGKRGRPRKFKPQRKLTKQERQISVYLAQDPQAMELIIFFVQMGSCYPSIFKIKELKKSMKVNKFDVLIANRIKSLRGSLLRQHGLDTKKYFFIRQENRKLEYIDDKFGVVFAANEGKITNIHNILQAPYKMQVPSDFDEYDRNLYGKLRGTLNLVFILMDDGFIYTLEFLAKSFYQRTYRAKKHKESTIQLWKDSILLANDKLMNCPFEWSLLNSQEDLNQFVGIQNKTSNEQPFKEILDWLRKKEEIHELPSYFLKKVRQMQQQDELLQDEYQQDEQQQEEQQQYEQQYQRTEEALRRVDQLDYLGTFLSGIYEIFDYIVQN